MSKPPKVTWQPKVLTYPLHLFSPQRNRGPFCAKMDVKRRQQLTVPSGNLNLIFVFADKQGWLSYWYQKFLKYSPLSFADEALERAFTEEQRAHGLSLGIAYFAALGSLAVLCIYVASSGSFEEWSIAWIFSGQSLLVSFLMYKFPNTASKYIQVCR